mgnify:CR=1 FL=1
MKKVLVFGDAVLDEYIFGEVNRVSPEAPVVILEYESNKIVLGGACNVATNIKTLLENDEEIKVHYYGWTSPVITSLLTGLGIPIKETNCEDKDILLKTRYVSNNHQILRVDTNKKYNKPFFYDFGFIRDYDLIVLSDYCKGTITTETLQKILTNSNCPILFDFKDWSVVYGSFFQRDFKRTILKCNEKEARISELKSRKPFIPNLNGIITLGSRGYEIIDGSVHACVKSGNVIDIVGAGDTFIAGMAVNFLETGNFDIRTMAEFANYCAAEKIRHFGTWAVKREDVEELRNELSR